MAKLLVTCDMSASLLPEHITDFNIPAIPCVLRTKASDFLEEREITCENIVAYIRREKLPPEIIPPTVEEYRRFFLEELEKSGAERICHFTVSSRLCENYRNAMEAAELLGNVFVIDSYQIGAGMCFSVLMGARMAGEGFGTEFIKKSIDSITGGICSSFYTPSTEFLRYSGEDFRCGAMEFLRRAPVISVKNGMLKKTSLPLGNFSRPGWKKYIKKELEGNKQINKELLILTLASPIKDDPKRYIETIKKYRDFKLIAVTRMSPLIASVTGDKSFGLTFLTR